MNKEMASKGAGLAIATGAILGLGAFIFIGLTPIIGHADTLNQYGNEYTHENMAYNLINNYKAKLKASKSFVANENINFNMNISDATKSESIMSNTVGYTVIDGDNLHSTATVTSAETGEQPEVKTAEIYQTKVGDSFKRYTITQEGTETETVEYKDYRDSYFPIEYRGNETVTLENGEYVVRGFLSESDYSAMSSVNQSTGSIDLSSGEGLEVGDVPYECRFNAATGDLTSMTIDMSKLLDTVMSVFTVFMDDTTNISSSMTYTSNIVIDPSQTVVIPSYLG